MEDETLDVIAVGAHPDDVEIGCGGTLARLAAQGYRVGIVDLTDGEPTPGSPGPEARLAESRSAAEILGVRVRVTLPLPNRRLFDDFDAPGPGKTAPPLPAPAGPRPRRADPDGLARPPPGDADHRGGDFLFPADQVARTFRPA